jgi:hypothetical protein
MPAREAISPTPSKDEGPSPRTGYLPGQPPGTGLRLPLRRSARMASHSEPHVASSSAGGEQAHGTPAGPSDRLYGPRGEVGGAGPEGPGPTGLVSEGRLHADPLDPNGVGWTLRDDDCPLDGAVAFDRTTGEIAWRATCKSARCRRCSRQVSAQTFALARRALEDGPARVRFITLTLAPEGWQETRAAVWRWLERLRRAGYRMHVLWVVEQGDETGMKHIHAVQWGDYIPKEVLSASWPYGSTQIEGARAATNYLAKGVVRYVAKGIDGDGASIETHMNLNGGRAAHWSREFFGGMSRDGYRAANPLPGIYFVETETGR